MTSQSIQTNFTLPITIPHNNSHETTLSTSPTTLPEQLSDLVNEWIWVKTKISIAIVGCKGVGKTFLANSLLESTFQDTHSEHLRRVDRNPTQITSPTVTSSKRTQNESSQTDSSIEKDFFLIEDEGSKTQAMDLDLESELKFSQYKRQEFTIDDNFSSSVNWRSEKEARTNIGDYWKNSHFNSTVSDRYPFLLPQGPFGTTFSRNYSITYGRIPEFTCTFVEEPDLRRYLWRLHSHRTASPSINTSGDGSNNNDTELQQIRILYRTVLNLPRDQAIPLVGLMSPDQLPIPQDILTVLGQAHCFKGRGSDINLDRIYVREKMLETINQYGPLLDSITVKMPCGVLKGNKELIIVNMSNTSSLYRKNPALDHANLLIVGLDRRGLSREISDPLRASGFFAKFLTKNDEHKLTFVALTEREEAESPLAATQMLHFKARDQISKARKYLITEIKKITDEIVGQPAPGFPTSLVPHLIPELTNLQRNPQQYSRVLNSINLLYVKPLLHSSLNILATSQEDFSWKFAGSIIEMKQKTNVPALLACIQNIVLSKSAKSLKEFSNNWMSRIKSRYRPQQPTPTGKDLGSTVGSVGSQGANGGKTKLFNKLVNLIPKKIRSSNSSTVQILESFHSQMTIWRNEIPLIENALLAVLTQRSKECNQQLFTSEATFELFTDFVVAFWGQRVVNRISRMTDEMIAFATRTLTECSKAVKLPVDAANEREKMKILQILKFCSSSVERTIRSRMGEFQRHLMTHRLDEMIRSSCLETMQVVIDKSSRYPQISELAIRNIHTHMCSLLIRGYSEYDVIQKAIEHSIQWLIGSPYLKPSQVMSFVLSQQRNSFNGGLDALGASGEIEPLGSNVLPSSAHFIMGFHQLHRMFMHEHNSRIMLPVMFSEQVWLGGMKGSAYSVDTFNQQLDKALLEIAQTTIGTSSTATATTTTATSNISSNSLSLSGNTMMSTTPTNNSGILTNLSTSLTNTNSLSNLINVRISSSQFRAFAFLVYGTEDGHSIVRLLLMNEILSNATLYSRIIMGLQSSNSNSNSSKKGGSGRIPLNSASVDEYVFSMSHDEEEGDLVTLLAFSHFYNVDILLYSPRFPQAILVQPQTILQTANNPEESPSLSHMNTHNNDTATTTSISHSAVDRETFGLALLEGNQYRALIKKAKPAFSNIDVETELKKLDQLNLQDKERESEDEMGDDMGSSPMMAGKKDKSKLLRFSVDIQTAAPINSNSSNGGVNSHNNVNGSNSIVQHYQITSGSVRSLTDMCLNVICKYIDYLPPLEGSLPEDLVQRIINILLTEGRLSEEILQKTLHFSMYSLSLKDYKNISPQAVRIIAENGMSLRKIDLSGCWQLQSDDLMRLSNHMAAVEEVNLAYCPQVDFNAVALLGKNCLAIEQLNLSHCNKVNDSAVQSISQLSKRLKRISLSNCFQLTDAAFQYLSSEILEIDLMECHLLSPISVEIVSMRCPRLTAFKASGSCVSDKAILALVTSCKQLESLELVECNELTDAGVHSIIRNCQKLVKLDLRGCKKITDSAFDIIDQWGGPGIRHLDLSKCINLSADAVNKIATSLLHLQYLNLSNCEEISEDALVKVVSSSSALTSLNLSGCTHTTDRVISHLSQTSRHIEHLILLNCNKITDKAMYDIARFPKLVELNVNSCENITDEGVVQIARSCHLLKNLHLEECKISDKGVMAITFGCPQMEVVSLAYCKDITNECLEYLKLCPNITSLDLSYAKNISVSNVSSSLRTWLKLQHLDLRGFSTFTNEIVKHPNLRSINLSWCKNLTDLAVEKLIEGSPSLESLQLAWCSQVSSKALHNLSRRLPFLRVLNLRGCNKIPVLMLKVLSSSGIDVKSN